MRCAQLRRVPRFLSAITSPSPFRRMRAIEMPAISDGGVGAADVCAALDVPDAVAYLFKQADDAAHVGDFVVRVAAMNFYEQARTMSRQGFTHAAQRVPF